MKAKFIGIATILLALTGCKNQTRQAAASGSSSTNTSVVSAQAATNNSDASSSEAKDAALAHQLYIRAIEFEQSSRSKATVQESLVANCKYSGLLAQAAELGDWRARWEYAGVVATIPSRHLHAAYCVEANPATWLQAQKYIAELMMTEKCKTNDVCLNRMGQFSDDIALKAQGVDDPESARNGGVRAVAGQTQTQPKVSVLKVERKYVTTSAWIPVATIRNNSQRDVEISLPYRAVRSDGVIVDQGKFFEKIPANSTVEVQSMGGMIMQEVEIKLGELQIYP